MADRATIAYIPHGGGPLPLMNDPECAALSQFLTEYPSTIDKPEAIVVTNGGQEALTIALMAVAAHGDIIAVESPTYCGMLELIESLGMLAIEVETCPQNGLSISALEKALDSHDIKACIFASCINNPLGSATTDAHRETLVGLLEDRGIPLIEDDVYGELMFDGRRPRLAQSYSRKNLVLTCGSFSKTAAPGYRIGWLLPGRFDEQARRLKRAFSCSSGLLQQLTLSEYIASGDYDRYLKTIRPLLRSNAERMTALIGRYFPARTRISRPAGGSVLWLELSEHIDSAELFDRACGFVWAKTPNWKSCLCQRQKSWQVQKTTPKNLKSPWPWRCPSWV